MISHHTTSMHRLLSAGLLLACDYLAVLVSEFLALQIRNALFTYSVYHVGSAYFFIVIPLIFIVFLAAQGLYHVKMPIYRMVEKIFYACLFSIGFSVVLLFIARVTDQVSRFYVAELGVFSFFFLVLFRYLMKKTVGKSAMVRTKILIIGAGKTADAFVREIEQDAGLNYDVAGFLEDNEPKTAYAKKYPVLGGFADLEKVAAETGVDAAVIAAPGLPQEELSALIYRAQSILSDVGVIPNLVAVPMSNVTVESFFDAKLMVLHVENNLAKRGNQIVKRIFDLCATIVGGILISPLLLVIAVWVYHDSPGPVIFKHRRVGKDGKEFNCYKFRSMVANSQEVLDHLLATDPAAKAEWDKEFKLKNDPRITKSGAFLRKTSLDELPQLLNVLEGEMSLVGPRPIVQKEVPRYGKFIKEYYSVLPGITGMWQVSGRSDIDYPERVQMDSWYVHNWSVWLDLVLLWRTIKVVATHQGAY